MCRIFLHRSEKGAGRPALGEAIVKRLDPARVPSVIEPPSCRRRGAPDGRAAGHQNRLDDTLMKSGSSLAVVGFFVDERGAAGAVPRFSAVDGVN